MSLYMGAMEWDIDGIFSQNCDTKVRSGGGQRGHNSKSTPSPLGPQQAARWRVVYYISRWSDLDLIVP